jgi:hypothetical protein
LPRSPALASLAVTIVRRRQASGREGWPLHAVFVWLGHTKLETTAKYLNLTMQYLHELNERVPLTLVRCKG